MSIPLVDLQAQYTSIKPEIDEAISRVLKSCAFAGGPEVEAFEQAFAKYVGAKHCIGVSSGTSAIEIILRAEGIGDGDEVIVQGNTFFATAEGASITGATPVFVDAEEATALIDVELIEKAITPKTKAIIPVHIYGQPADIDPIKQLAKKHKLFLIEDCAQAHGAKYRGEIVGKFGDAAAFSFYPGKNLGAYGEAGAIMTNDDRVADFCRKFRDHGSKTKYEHVMVGRNDRMDGIQGAVLGVKLKHLDEWNAKRRVHAATYRRLLKDVPSVRMLNEAPDREHVYHLFVVRVPHRDALKTALNDKGIGAGIHYPGALHLQEVYKCLNYDRGDLPVSERLADDILSLPLYPEMTEEQIKFVVSALKEELA